MFYLVLLQAATPNILTQLWPLLLMFVVVFFFFIRPQAKKQKEQAKFLDTLEKGEEVVTTSGMIGRVNKIEGSIITLAVSEKNFIRVTKGSVSKEMTEAFRKSEHATAESSSN